MRKIIVATLLATVAVAGQAHAEAASTSDGERANRGEMRSQMLQLGPEGFAELMRERAGERFDRLDADGDGTISREEFLAATGERAETMFQRMGPNEDGVVTRSARERGGFGRHNRGPRGDHGRSMRGMDSEQRAERLSARAAEEFARLDTDGDGVISLEEFEAGLQARVERFAERRQNRGERMEQRAERRGEGRHRGMRGPHAELREMMREGMSLEDFAGHLETRAAARFDRLDANEDGQITRDEFLASVDQRAERVFARMERMEQGERPRRGGWHHRRGPAAE